MVLEEKTMYQISKTNYGETVLQLAGNWRRRLMRWFGHWTARTDTNERVNLLQQADVIRRTAQTPRAFYQDKRTGAFHGFLNAIDLWRTIQRTRECDVYRLKRGKNRFLTVLIWFDCYLDQPWALASRMIRPRCLRTVERCASALQAFSFDRGRASKRCTNKPARLWVVNAQWSANWIHKWDSSTLLRAWQTAMIYAEGVTALNILIMNTSGVRFCFVWAQCWRRCQNLPVRRNRTRC